MGLPRRVRVKTDSMSRILNSRNAILGWFAWRFAKRSAPKRARQQRHLLRYLGIGSTMTLVVGAALVGRRPAREGRHSEARTWYPG